MIDDPLKTGWSIDATALPVHQRLSLLANAVAELMTYAPVPSEQWRRDRIEKMATTATYSRPIQGAPKLGMADVPITRLYPKDPHTFPNRARVDDHPMIPRTEMQSDQDYGQALHRFHDEVKSGMHGVTDQGFLLLEWDLAIDALDWCEMMAYIYSDPQAVWAAPYYLFYRSDGLTPPSQVPDGGLCHEDGTVDFVPLGCTYLPHRVLEMMWADGQDGAIQYPTPDHTFNQWANSRGVVRKMAYYVRPKHLHFGHSVSFAPKR